MNGNLRIYETFSSIQGESSFAGIPCFFIRLAGCPLRCSYCDTKKAQPFEAGEILSVETIVSRADESGIPLVEVTGGEPLAQKDTPLLCAALARAGHKVLIETNGAMDCSVLPPETVRILDIKTPSSGESDSVYEPNFRTLRPCDEVKFVLLDRADYEFARAALTRYDLPSQITNILFSPGYGILNPADLCNWILEDRLPVRINLQFHKIIWGPDREGV